MITLDSLVEGSFSLKHPSYAHCAAATGTGSSASPGPVLLRRWRCFLRSTPPVPQSKAARVTNWERKRNENETAESFSSPPPALFPIKLIQRLSDFETASAKVPKVVDAFL